MAHQALAGQLPAHQLIAEHGAAARMVAGDSGDFRVVNDFARQTSWLHTFFTAVAVWGLVLFAGLLLLGWWSARQDRDRARLARLIWAPLGALVAVGVNQPIAHAINEQRPFAEMPNVLTLIDHAANAGFPSDHATAAGALAAGLWLASRRLGVMAALAAGLVAFSRVYVGVHYPVDVLAGLALGVVVTTVGYLLARPALTWLLALIDRTPLRWLTTAPSPEGGASLVADPPPSQAAGPRGAGERPSDPGAGSPDRRRDPAGPSLREQ